ncbi:hypothetical protein [Candidatus Allofournierella excrementigallinarum]|uniref:hypothetical protein n=1 Tax=Candidatus Allofournierella excrementigallinarum TaxID=2838592 RepID=UPI00374E78CC
MAKRLRAGDVIPEFRFDTPYRPQQSFYELLEGEKPVFLVFLRNFGHPLTRNYIMEYIKSAGSLRSARLVCVVQTRPQTISRAIPEGAMPYELMCDAEGVLYRFFAVPSEKSRMKCFSLKAMKIINEAKKKGFRPRAGEAWQLPLTLLVGPAGRVLLAHYGATLTDLPEDCAAMEELAADLLPALPAEWLAAAPAAPVADSFSAAFGAAPAAPAKPAPAAPQADGGPFEAGFDTPLEAFDAPEPGGTQDLDAPTEALAAPASPAAPAAPAAQPEAPRAPAVDLAALGFGAGN